MSYYHVNHPNDHYRGKCQHDQRKYLGFLKPKQLAIYKKVKSYNNGRQYIFGDAFLSFHAELPENFIPETSEWIKAVALMLLRN
jgi:hypothetical protein